MQYLALISCRYWVRSLSKRSSAANLRLGALVIIAASSLILRLTVPHFRMSTYQANARAHDIINRVHLNSCDRSHLTCDLAHL